MNFDEALVRSGKSEKIRHTVNMLFGITTKLDYDGG